MALKAVHVSDVPHLDHVPENAALNFYSTAFSKGVEVGRNSSFKAPKFLVLGHRGNGMNRLQSSDRRMKAVKENTILSFNTAAQFPIDFIEFDVQVTKDGCPIIFHDDFIVSQENGIVFEKRVTELTLSEFLSFGPQNPNQNPTTKPLMRKLKDGRIIPWTVETDDTLCTLQETFEKVSPHLGFDIELKFDDHIVYAQDHLLSTLNSIMNVVYQYAKDRPIFFSSFQPDAALLLRKLQSTYPVFFLTNGGTELFHDVRRNSLEEAMKLALQGGLQGIVSEVKGVFQNPGVVTKIKEAKLSLLTYGQLNNVSEAVYLQHLMGIDGVCVDYVKDITEALDDLMIKPPVGDVNGNNKEVEEGVSGGNDDEKLEMKPQFSQRELAFLLKLIPQLIQQ